MPEKAAESYGTRFYEESHRQSKASAEVILPHVLEMIPGVRSVVDIGCGTGVWLSVFRSLGVQDVLGLDGDWVLGANSLVIPRESFIPSDLNRSIELGRKFDLAISIEVGEHLEPKNSDAFVDSLASLSDVVLFSAAIPGQGGTHHINEQWPDYWADRFRAVGYEAFDVVRCRVWDDSRIGWCRHNILIYVREGANPELSESLRRRVRGPLRIVHPDLYRIRTTYCDPQSLDISVGQAARLLLTRMRRSLALRVGLGGPAKKG